jgi:hypothetical protein
MMLSPLVQGGSVTELSVTGRYRLGKVMNQHGTVAIQPLFNIAHYRKVDNSERIQDV